MRVVAVAVEPVGLALVAEETGVGGELQLGVHAGGDLAAVGLQVRVQVFAVSRRVSFWADEVLKIQITRYLLVCALLGGRVVVAALVVGVGAVVLSVAVRRQRVVGMIPGVLHLSALLGLLAKWFSLKRRE